MAGRRKAEWKEGRYKKGRKKENLRKTGKPASRADQE